MAMRWRDDYDASVARRARGTGARDVETVAIDVLTTSRRRERRWRCGALVTIEDHQSRVARAKTQSQRD
jgi:hypothetical protein